MRPSFLQKKIPTLLGVSLLVVGLVVGVLFIGSGGSLNFAPRAAPQTTPKSVKITNVSDTTFSVSFMTDEVSSGFVKYGTDANTLNKQASDDRDQLTGSVGQYTTHHITLRNLQPGTTYYYTLGTISVPKFDNNGVPFSTKTGPKLGSTPAAKTAYGTVTGGSVDGVIIYLQIAGAGELSTLVKNSGSWAIPLSAARTTDGTKYATLEPTTDVTVTAQGKQPSNILTVPAKLSELQPLPAITLTGTETSGNSTAQTTASTANTAQTDSVTQTGTDTSTFPAQNALTTTTNTATTQTDNNSTLPPADSTIPANTNQGATTQTPVVDVKEKGDTMVPTSQPVITGTAPANVTVSISIHSTTEIKTSVKTDAQGQYSVDLAQLGKNLEPGEHTVTISYKDPKTGKTVTETKKFTVEASAATAATSTTQNTTGNVEGNLLALANTTPQPYGTSNPYTIPTPSPDIPALTPTATPSAQPVSTTSAIPKSGAVENTIAMLVGGGLLIGLGSIKVAFSKRKVS